jgi:DNA-binding transcriptional LysR family regulator
MKRASPTPRRSVPAATSRRLLQAVQPTIAAATLNTSQLLALQAFDVAFRTGSFKASAQSLNLSPSAVSHRIRNLEQALGAALFVRTHRAIAPTAEGKILAAATGRAFAELARVGSSAAGRAARQRLRLKVLPMFASAWLIPRLAGFMTRHPDVDLAIESSSRNVDFELEAFDAGISVGDGTFEGMTAHHLAAIRTTPVAAPSLARRLNLREPRDLRRAALIHVTAFPAAWPLWLEHAGVAKLKPARTISVDSFVAAMQAAEQGAGVALGLEPFIIERERHGMICRPLSLAHPTGSYWLVHPPGAQHNHALQVFKRWLLAELPTSGGKARFFS